MMTQRFLRIRRRRTEAVAAVLLVSAVVAGCTSAAGGNGSRAATFGPTGGTAVRPSSASTTSAKSPASATVRVHVSVNLADGATVGVGMPYIATFNHKITDGRAFQKATKVTVDGNVVVARWYFEYSAAASGHVMEAHLRTEKYWPAHASIHVDLPVQGLAGGAVGHQPNSTYVFDNSLTSDFATGDARIASVDASTHTLTVRDDGKVWATFPVSLGDPKSETKRGIKVIMEKVPTVCMHDTAGTYYHCGIKDDQRLTYDGEYLHAAPWNTYNIDHGINSSNGCTNLHPADANKLYAFLQIGDPVEFPNADGKRMQLGDGYGDWNVTWPLWETGGAVPTA